MSVEQHAALVALTRAGELTSPQLAAELGIAVAIKMKAF